MHNNVSSEFSFDTMLQHCVAVNISFVVLCFLKNNRQLGCDGTNLSFSFLPPPPLSLSFSLSLSFLFSHSFCRSWSPFEVVTTSSKSSQDCDWYHSTQTIATTLTSGWSSTVLIQLDNCYGYGINFRYDYAPEWCLCVYVYIGILLQRMPKLSGVAMRIWSSWFAYNSDLTTSLKGVMLFVCVMNWNKCMSMIIPCIPLVLRGENLKIAFNIGLQGGAKMRSQAALMKGSKLMIKIKEVCVGVPSWQDQKENLNTPVPKYSGIVHAERLLTDRGVFSSWSWFSSQKTPERKFTSSLTFLQKTTPASNRGAGRTARLSVAMPTPWWPKSSGIPTMTMYVWTSHTISNGHVVFMRSRGGKQLLVGANGEWSVCLYSLSTVHGRTEVVELDENLRGLQMNDSDYWYFWTNSRFCFLLTSIHACQRSYTNVFQQDNRTPKSQQFLCSIYFSFSFSGCSFLWRKESQPSRGHDVYRSKCHPVRRWWRPAGALPSIPSLHQRRRSLGQYARITGLHHVYAQLDRSRSDTWAGVEGGIQR